jgi:hypothetical protein
MESKPITTRMRQGRMGLRLSVSGFAIRAKCRQLSMGLSVEQATCESGFKPGTAGRRERRRCRGPFSFARKGMFAH